MKCSEPTVGFEPTCAFAARLQGASVRPLRHVGVCGFFQRARVLSPRARDRNAHPGSRIVSGSPPWVGGRVVNGTGL